MVRWIGLVAICALCLTCDRALGDSSILTVRERALTAIRAERWPEAVTEYEKWASLNPTCGPIWSDLGLAYLRSGLYEESIHAYQQALKTGFRPEECQYNVACAYALAGNPSRAVVALSDAYARGYVNDENLRTDADLASLHGDERFRALVGWPVPNVTDRRQRWLGDLDFLSRRLRELHWRLFDNITESEFDDELSRIRSAISNSSDIQLRLMTQRLLARIGDGHTGMMSDFFRLHHSAPGGPPPILLPIDLFWFEDGVRVVGAAPDLESVAGARVWAVGNLPVDSLLTLLQPFVSRDNEWGARWGTMQALTNPYILEGLGVGSVQTGFPFVFVLEDGTQRSIEIRPGGAENAILPSLPAIKGTDTTLFYREKHKSLWMQPVAGALYVRIDMISDGSVHGESFADFTERVFTTASGANSEALIIDLRDNLGGQGHLTRPFMRRLMASDQFNREGGLYVLVGRKTFSAAMAFAAQIELHTKAWFVGEPTGSRPNFVGETSIITLPYSQISLSVSSRYHQNGDSNDKRLWIAPDIPASPDFSMMIHGRDPAIEAVLKLVN